jgi:dihydrolipoamide dehydrogenase
MTIQTDIAILGGGPGGYVAALHAAKLGARVALIEQDRIGGVCLNVGCIPTKALLRSAEVYRTLQHAGSFGLRLDGTIAPDWPAIQERKAGIVAQLVGGVEKLLSRAGVRVIHGWGRFASPHALAVDTAEGSLSVEATRGVIVATGSRPIRLPLPGIDLPGVVDSTGALGLADLPQRLLIVGGGVVGVELAEIFTAFGVQVTVVEMLDRLLPQMDADLGAGLAWTFEQRDVRVHLNSRLEHVDSGPGGLLAAITAPGGPLTVEADRILIAVGRRPNVENLGLDLAGVRVERTGIPVNGQTETNIPGLYAVGDVTGVAPLAHVAMQGGEVAVENALGRPAKLDLKTVPWLVYTDPEVAGVGLTEAQAREAGYDVLTGRFPLNANGKALTYGETAGFVKVVSEVRYGEVLGLHLIAPHASDLIHEGGLALTLEATLDELINTLHGHPTLGEAIREAALECRGGALHLPH